MRVARARMHVYYTETENPPIVLHRFGSTRNRARFAYTLLKISYFLKKTEYYSTKMRKGEEGGGLPPSTVLVYRP